MGTIPTIIAFVVIVLAVYSLARLVRRGRRMNQYFCNALRVYVWLCDDAAKWAAIAAAKAAPPKLRKGMVDYAENLIRILSPVAEESPDLKDFIPRLERLRNEIAASHWTAAVAIEAKASLGQHSREYLDALNRADPEVFVDKHPELFKAKNVSQLIRAAAREKRSRGTLQRAPTKGRFPRG